jgi:acyl-CoA dehydrogenase
VNFTNHILDSGSTPSVITAIMKQQTTERARTVLNHGMDIYSGSGICVGENNFFTKFYNASPVGITVEGSNTLTRGLIIFGQGLNKSHPHIFPIFQSIQDNNLDNFKENFDKMLLNIGSNYFENLASLRLFSNYNKQTAEQRLDRATLKFSLLSNFVAIMGGKIKSSQMISGNMSDILSNLYLSYSLIWYYHHYHYGPTTSKFLRDECIHYLMNELDYKMNLVVANYPNPFIRTFLYPLTNKISYPDLESKNKLYKIILENEQLHNIFQNDIFYEGTVLEKMEKLRKMKPKTEEYKQLYQDIIKVGEFKI